jgi:hypothetical protein
MKRTILEIVLIAAILTGCSLPTANTSPTPSNHELETQVAQLLTTVPSTGVAQPTIPAGNITVIPSQPATLAAAPTVTSLPTVTPEPTQAATEAATGQVTPTTAPTTSTTPTATTSTGATPGTTPTVSATVSAGDPVAKLGTPTWQDSFANDTNWSTVAGKFTSITVGGNKLQITGLTAIDGWRLTAPTITDFYLEATFQTGTCAGSDRYGLITRIPDLATANSGYLVGLTCDGKYSLRKWDGTNMRDLIAWTTSDTIKSGSNQTNRLGLLAVGSQMTVYVNGIALKSASDSTYTSGHFGVFIGANQTPNLTITATQIAYWENPKF